MLTGTSVASNLIDPYYICTTEYDDVLVTDFAEPNIKTLTVGGDSGSSSGEYGVIKPQGLLQPYGCYRDAFGLTFIADNRNDRVGFIFWMNSLLCPKNVITECFFKIAKSKYTYNEFSI